MNDHNSKESSGRDTADHGLVDAVEVMAGSAERFDHARTIDPLHPPARIPTLRHMLSHPAHIIAHGFGSGLLRPAPGTWGTLFAWASFVAINPFVSPVHWAWLIGVGFLLGVWACAKTGQALGATDHGSLVWDEVIAFWCVLIMIPNTVLAQAVGFILFRAFDIAKPPPIRWFDQRFKNGFGVMFDDLLAAFYALLVFAIIQRLTQ